MEFAAQAAGIGALADPVRRALYEHVTRQPHAVGREAAAAALDIPAHTAKFHLERLVEEGLLEVEFRRLTGRSGPGAGRPAKLYSRAEREISVSLPPRRYDLVGNLLAAAIARVAHGEPLADALEGAARAAGIAHGERAVEELADAGTDEATRMSLTLEELRFEPHTEPGMIRLTNCPFHSLAQEHTALVCGVNRDYVQGVADGLGCASAGARLDPRAGSCCVRVDLDVSHENGAG